MKTIFLILLIVTTGSFAQTTKTVWLDDLPIQTFAESIRPTMARVNYTKDSMRIGGVYFNRGVGVQTISIISFLLDGNAKNFTAMVGADDMGNKDIALKFYVIGDKKILFESSRMKPGDAAQKVNVSLEGIKRLGLLVTDTAGGYNNKRTNGNWGNAQLQMIGDHDPQHVLTTGEKYILTPPSPATPRINSATVFGATSGNPFLYTIAATGKRPLQFSAENLPQGLSLDKLTGIISGTVKQKGIYAVKIKAKNTLGEAIKELKIKIGDTIALTPPIGWNGWNAWESRIDREKVLASANAMKSMGLSDHGWTYINIDDSWQGRRGGELNALQPNEKFPNIKGMVNYIHSLGLKAGIYSTPYIASYGGYPGAASDFPNGGETHEAIMKNRSSFHHPGKYRFEKEDALQMAEWGFDFLKYDWRVDVNSTERMSEALRKSGRDIVFSLSNSAPFEHVQDWMRLSNMWRTGPDIKDTWPSLYLTVFTLDRWSPYGGPGHWNDGDMMIVGNVSIGPELHPTRLTPDEQYSHVSIFSLLAAPLLIGCPIEQLDAFTLNLLTNDEVIAVNQDPLGKPARLLSDENGVQIWMKPMEDGSYAVGLFNTGSFGATPQSYFHWGDEPAKAFSFDFNKVGLKGKWKLRDVWRQKNLGEFEGSFKTTIPHHGVVMLRMMQK
jgi:alpha-galactosidase